MARTARCALSWSFPEWLGAGLTCDKTAWRVFKLTAKIEGMHADEMISMAVARLVGSISKYRVKS